MTLILAQDSSGCGGFSSLSQTQTLHPGVQTTYQSGNDIYKITPLSGAGGESLTMTLVPVLKSVFDAHRPPAPFNNESCIPFGDLTQAAHGVETCGEWQAECAVGNDCATMLYVAVEDYDLPASRPAIGGPDSIVLHGVGCPPPDNGFNQTDFLAYSVNRLDPGTKKGGGGTGTCFAVTFTPGAPLITSGTVTGSPTSRFVGFQSPVSDTALNMVHAGAARPLLWRLFDAFHSPVTNLTLCPNTSGMGCIAPWVNVQAITINCPSNTTVNTSTDLTTVAAGNSGLQNNGNGNYTYVWKTQKGWSGCATVVLQFDPTIDSGLVVAPANFEFN